MSALCLSATAREAISLHMVTRKLKSIQLKPILLLSPGHQLATQLHTDTTLATCRVCPLFHFASISTAIIGTAYLTILHALPPSDNNSFFQLATLITYAYYTHCLSKHIHMKKAKRFHVQLNLVVAFLLFLPKVKTRRDFYDLKVITRNTQKCSMSTNTGWLCGLLQKTQNIPLCFYASQ